MPINSLVFFREQCYSRLQHIVYIRRWFLICPGKRIKSSFSCNVEHLVKGYAKNRWLIVTSVLFLLTFGGDCVTFMVHQVFGITDVPEPSLDGNILPNPIDPKTYMVMLCYKNGSLTREGTLFSAFQYTISYS